VAVAEKADEQAVDQRTLPDDDLLHFPDHVTEERALLFDALRNGNDVCHFGKAPSLA
jgi:hypothetical protein